MLDFFSALFVSISVFLPRIWMGRRVESDFLTHKRWIGLIIIYIIAGYFSPLLVSYASIGVVYFWEFYHYLHKDKKLSLFYSIYVLMAYDYVSFFVYTIFNKIVSVETDFIWFNTFDALFGLVSLGISLLIFRYLKIDYEQLESNDGRKIIRKIWLPIASLMGLFLISVLLYFSNVPYSDVYDTTVALIVFFCFLMILLYIQAKQRELSETADKRLLENQNHALAVDVEYLSQLYDDIRGFRHDVAGIVGAMNAAIESEDMTQVKQVYHRVFIPMDDQLQSLEYTAFDLGHIKDLGLRNALAYEMLKAKNKQIPFQLEIIDDFPHLMDDELSVIRIVDILLDNAIEGAAEAVHPMVEVALVKETDSVTMTIRNTRKSQELNQQTIWEMGNSTKGDSRGLGLANVNKLLKQLPDLFIHTHIGENDFTQTLIFERGDHE